MDSVAGLVVAALAIREEAEAAIAQRKVQAAFVEEMRMSEACRRLSERRVGIDAVAGSLGYHSGDVFRRAFERRFGVSPTTYRSRFQAPRLDRSE